MPVRAPLAQLGSQKKNKLRSKWQYISNFVGVNEKGVILYVRPGRRREVTVSTSDPGAVSVKNGMWSQYVIQVKRPSSRHTVLGSAHEQLPTLCGFYTTVPRATQLWGAF